MMILVLKMEPQMQFQELQIDMGNLIKLIRIKYII